MPKDSKVSTPKAKPAPRPAAVVSANPKARVTVQDVIIKHRRVIASGTKYGLAEFDDFCKDMLDVVG